MNVLSLKAVHLIETNENLLVLNLVRMENVEETLILTTLFIFYLFTVYFLQGVLLYRHDK